MAYPKIMRWICGCCVLLWACAADPPATDQGHEPTNDPTATPDTKHPSTPTPNPTLHPTPDALDTSNQVPTGSKVLPTQLNATALHARELFAASDAAAILQIPQGDAQSTFDLFAAWNPHPASTYWPREWSLTGLLTAHPPLAWINQWPTEGRASPQPLLISLLEPSPAALQKLLAGGGAGLTRVWIQTADANTHHAALLDFLKTKGLIRQQSFWCGNNCSLLSTPDASLHVLLSSDADAARVKLLALRIGCAPSSGPQALWEWLASEDQTTASPLNPFPTRALSAWSLSPNPSLLWLPERLLQWADAEQQHSAQRPILEAPLSRLNDAWLQMEFMRWKRRLWMQNTPQHPLSASALLRDPDGVIRALADSDATQPTPTPPKPWPLLDTQTPDAPFLEWIWQPSSPPTTPWVPLPKDLDDWPELGQIIRHPGLLSIWHVLPLLRTPGSALHRLASITLGLGPEQLSHLRGVHLSLHGWPSERSGASIRGSLAVVFDTPLAAHDWIHQAHHWTKRQKLEASFAFLPNPLGVAVVAAQHCDPNTAFAVGASHVPAAHVYLALTPLAASPEEPNEPFSTPEPLILTACEDAQGWNTTLYTAPIACQERYDSAHEPVIDHDVWRRGFPSVSGMWAMFTANVAAGRFAWDRAAEGYEEACEANITSACSLSVRALTRAQAPNVDDRVNLPPYVYSDKIFEDSLFLVLRPDGAWADGMRLPCDNTPTHQALEVLRELLSGEAAWHPRPVVLDLPASTPWEQVVPWLAALHDMGLHNDLSALADTQGGPIVVKVALSAAGSLPHPQWSPSQTPPLPICERVLAASASEIPAASIAGPDLQPLVLSAAPKPIVDATRCALSIVRYADRFSVSVDEQPSTEFEDIEALYTWVAEGTLSGCDATLWISLGLTWTQTLETIALLRHRRAQDWAPLMTPLSTFKEKKDKSFKESIGDILYPLDLLPLLRLSVETAQ